MNEQKTWHRRLILERAHGQEKMGLLGSPAHAVHPAFYRNAAIRLVKRERLYMVLQQNRAVWKELGQRTAEFVEYKFVSMKWIRSGGATRIGVVVLIRR